MYRVIYTKANDSADTVEAYTLTYENKTNAIAGFCKAIEPIYNEILRNEFLKANISFHLHKAVIRIEDTVYCVVMQEVM